MTNGINIIRRCIKDMKYHDLVKPSFEVNFWLKHFRGMDDEMARSYEAFLMSPLNDTMFFSDTCEWYEDDFIDCTSVVESLTEKINNMDIHIEGAEIEGIEIENML